MDSVLQNVYRHGLRKLLAKKILRTEKEDGCLKWGIVGTGYMASTWADLLLRSPIGQLHSVCSRSPIKAREFGRKFGCDKVFGKLEEMLADVGEGLDFVYIATPLASHFEIIQKCIELGVNVLSEKPATENAEEWSVLAQLAKQRGVLLIEGMWMLCLPTFRQAESWIEEGQIGEVKWIRADLHKFQAPVPGSARRDTGVLMDYGVYALSFACHFLGGSPDWCQSHWRQHLHGADADWAIVAGRQDRTAVINVSSNFHTASRAAVIGTSGVIEWGSPFNRTDEITLRSFKSSQEHSKHFTYSNLGFEFQLEEVTRTLREGLSESRILNHQMTFDALSLADRAWGQIVKPTH
jgi:predicted dehydrogenase